MSNDSDVEWNRSNDVLKRFCDVSVVTSVLKRRFQTSLDTNPSSDLF